MGKFDKSITVLNDAVTIAEDFEDELMDGRIMLSYGTVYHVQKEYDKSKASLSNAINHFQNMNRNNLVLQSMMKLIQIHLDLSEMNSAKSMYEKCKKISKRVNDPLILSALNELSNSIK